MRSAVWGCNGTIVGWGRYDSFKARNEMSAGLTRCPSFASFRCFTFFLIAFTHKPKQTEQQMSTRDIPTIYAIKPCLLLFGFGSTVITGLSSTSGVFSFSGPLIILSTFFLSLKNSIILSNIASMSNLLGLDEFTGLVEFPG